MLLTQKKLSAGSASLSDTVQYSSFWWNKPYTAALTLFCLLDSKSMTPVMVWSARRTENRWRPGGLGGQRGWRGHRRKIEWPQQRLTIDSRGNEASAEEGPEQSRRRLVVRTEPIMIKVCRRDSFRVSLLLIYLNTMTVSNKKNFKRA